MKVVSDTTTLIAFLGLGKLSILKELFGSRQVSLGKEEGQLN